MKHRYKTERQSNLEAFELLGRNPTEQNVHEAIKQLEDCVKNGLIYHACELSDWIAFVAQDKLKTNKELGQRFRIERLKRLGYLNFFEQEKICRDDLCESEDLKNLLNADESTELDDTRFILYTAIGHTLWHENDIEVFNTYFEYYRILFFKLTKNFPLKKEMHAFLYAMEGRSEFLRGGEATSVMTPFENALKLIGSHKMRSRMGLHLINYYLNHLNKMYSDKAFERYYIPISQRIDELFKVFDKCRLPPASKKDKPLEPIKTLLQLHFGLHKLHKMQRDLCLNSSDLSASQKNKTDIDNTRTKLLYTALMLGLGSLNPCPPLLQDIYDFADNQQSMFDSNEAKSMLKKHLNNLDYKSFERVAYEYFKHMNYEVKILEDCTKAYDLIASRKFEGSIGINAEAKVGIQAKYWDRKFYAKDFNEWLPKAISSENSNCLTGIIFFLKGSHHKDVEEAATSAAANAFHTLQTGIEFWDLDMITDMLWSKPGCLPMIYGVIENIERDNGHFQE